MDALEQLNQFKTQLLALLHEQQQNAVADILRQISASPYRYDTVAFQSIQSSMSPLGLGLMAAQIVQSTETLIGSLAEQQEDSLYRGNGQFVFRIEAFNDNNNIKNIKYAVGFLVYRNGLRYLLMPCSVLEKENNGEITYTDSIKIYNASTCIECKIMVTDSQGIDNNQKEANTFCFKSMNIALLMIPTTNDINNNKPVASWFMASFFDNIIGYEQSGTTWGLKEKRDFNAIETIGFNGAPIWKNKRMVGIHINEKSGGTIPNAFDTSLLADKLSIDTKPYIKNQSVWDSIDTFMKNNSQILVIEGDSGVGKTETLVKIKNVYLNSNDISTAAEDKYKIIDFYGMEADSKYEIMCMVLQNLWVLGFFKNSPVETLVKDFIDKYVGKEKNVPENYWKAYTLVDDHLESAEKDFYKIWNEYKNEQNEQDEQNKVYEPEQNKVNTPIVIFDSIDSLKKNNTLFQWVVGNDSKNIHEQGLLKLLLNHGISIVISGKPSANEAINVEYKICTKIQKFTKEEIEQCLQRYDSEVTNAKMDYDGFLNTLHRITDGGVPLYVATLGYLLENTVDAESKRKLYTSVMNCTPDSYKQLLCDKIMEVLGKKGGILEIMAVAVKGTTVAMIKKALGDIDDAEIQSILYDLPFVRSSAHYYGGSQEERYYLHNDFVHLIEERLKKDNTYTEYLNILLKHYAETKLNQDTDKGDNDGLKEYAYYKLQQIGNYENKEGRQRHQRYLALDYVFFIFAKRLDQYPTFAEQILQVAEQEVLKWDIGENVFDYYAAMLNTALRRMEYYVTTRNMNNDSNNQLKQLLEIVMSKPVNADDIKAETEVGKILLKLNNNISTTSIVWTDNLNIQEVLLSRIYALIAKSKIYENGAEEVKEYSHLNNTIPTIWEDPKCIELFMHYKNSNNIRYNIDEALSLASMIKIPHRVAWINYLISSQKLEESRFFWSLYWSDKATKLAIEHITTVLASARFEGWRDYKDTEKLVEERRNMPKEFSALYRSLKTIQRSLGTRISANRISGHPREAICYALPLLYLQSTTPNNSIHIIETLQQLCQTYAAIKNKRESNRIFDFLSNSTNSSTSDRLYTRHKILDQIMPKTPAVADKIEDTAISGMAYMYTYNRFFFQNRLKLMYKISIDKIIGIAFTVQEEEDYLEYQRHITEDKVNTATVELLGLKAKFYLLKGQFTSARKYYDLTLQALQKAQSPHLYIDALIALVSMDYYETNTDITNQRVYQKIKEKFNIVKKNLEFLITKKGYKPYHDLWAKYHTLYGHFLIDIAFNKLHSAESFSMGKDFDYGLENYIQACKHSYKFNYHRYIFSLETLSRGIGYIGKKYSEINLNLNLNPNFNSNFKPELQKIWKQCNTTTEPRIKRRNRHGNLLLAITENYLMDWMDTHKLDIVDKDIKGYIQKLIDAANLKYTPSNNEGVLKKTEETIVNYAQELIAKSNFKKAIELTWFIVRYQEEKTLNNHNAEGYIDKIIYGYWRLIFCYQSLDDSKGISKIADHAKSFFEKDLNNSTCTPYRIIISVAQNMVACNNLQYRKTEYFIHYKEIVVTQNSFDEIVENSQNNISSLLDYIKIIPAETERDKKNRLAYTKILAELCLQLGEINIILGNNALNGNLRTSISIFINQYMIDTAKANKGEVNIESKIAKIKKQLDNHNEYLCLQYALALGRLNHLNRTDKIDNETDSVSDYLVMKALLNIANATKLDPRGIQLSSSIIYSIKQKCLKPSALSPFNSEVLGVQEIEADNIRLNPIFRKVSFFTESYYYPSIYAKVELMQGQQLFCRYFVPDEDVYKAIYDIQNEDRDSNFLYLEKFTETKANNDNSKSLRDTDYYRMAKHFIDALALCSGNSFIEQHRLFDEMLIEIERIILVCPCQIFIDTFKKTLQVLWTKYDMLAKRPNSLKVLETTLELKGIAISIDKRI